ncbi:tetratricopeptide repeat protein [Myxococcus sp. RHSTA-1-4]|uniref:tetratricopeptide repeat protein n=1 Tax=Myxococcus sp. RHSTA-1-4 TaxID=2874601 RepID=UPI001CBB6655|nr:tetratricopeptide repeat protein [Myxococcus sp. RHSTA-1-4]MBZ4415035.1 tetratricopeptide repeat protein [Myxococcus sp. RHSTA-1-4]
MRLAFVLSAALALAPPVALAQRGARNPTALIREGERLYQAGKYREAAEALKKAQEMSPNPKLIYNIAVALENAGELREALSWYQQYVGNTEGTDATLLKRSARGIDRIQVLLKKEEQQQAAAEAERQKLQGEAEAARRKAEEEQLAARRAEEENQRRQQAEYARALKSYQRQRIAAFAVGGVAVAGVGAGVLFGMQARDSREQFDAATRVEDKQARADDTKSKALLADIGFGVGLAGAITAIILYPKEGPPVAGEVRVTLAPRGAGAGMEVSF